MNLVDVMKAAWAKIDSPEKWTTEAYARNSRGISTIPTDPEATCFCSLGAVRAVRGATREECKQAIDLLGEQAIRLGHEKIIGLNDYAGYETVTKMFADAIAKAEEQEASDESR